MEDPVIIVDQVSKRYFINRDNTKPGPPEKLEFWPLRNISFKLYKGDILGIVGKNGAGKSTLLRLMSAISRPTLGTIKIVGRSASILDSGLGFHDDLTGRENIFLSGCLLGLSTSEINEKLNEIITFSEIEAFIDSPVKFYSTGMALRLASSITLALDVDILMIDEQLFSGDVYFRQKIVDKINSKLQQGLAVIHVSHSINEILNFCNKCMLIENGEIIQFDTPGKILVKYLNDTILDNGNTRPDKGQIQAGHSRLIVWDDNDAPGSDKIRLRQISVDPVDIARSEISIDDAFKITILFEKLVSDITVQLHIVFFDQYKNPLFSCDTFNNSGLEMKNDSYKSEKGLFAYEVEIPPYFLYKGIYSMQLRFGTNMLDEDLMFFVPLSFSIGPSAMDRHYIGDDLPVFIRPSFHWALRKI